MEKQLVSLEIKDFKRFERLEVPLDKPIVIIYGPNGSGKSQILWSIVLYCRAHNTRFVDSQWYHIPAYLSLVDEAPDFLHPTFKQGVGYTNFVRQQSQKQNEEVQRASFIAHFDDGDSCLAELQANGKLEIKAAAGISHQKKIGFAFMLPTFAFDVPKEVRLGAPLTSHTPCIRAHYHKLSEEHRALIRQHMQQLFGQSITLIIPGEAGGGLVVMVTETTYDSTATLEVQHMGAAFQKVFASLVLFYRLLMPYYEHQVSLSGGVQPISERLYLIEEPEAVLYPSLVQTFFTLLRDLCAQHQVKLIATTHDQWITSQGDTKIALSATYPGKVEEEKGLQSLKEALGHTIAGGIDRHMNAKVIACEGPGDETFLRHLASLVGNQLQGVTFLHMKGKNLEIKDSEKLLPMALQATFPTATVCVLRDPDFRRDPPNSVIVQAQQGKPGHKLLWWKLPAIESFIFVCYCLEAKGTNSDPLTFLRDIDQFQVFTFKYFTSLKQDTSPQNGGAMWGKAWKSIQKPLNQQAVEDYIAVAKILHGHTWVETLRHNGTIPPGPPEESASDSSARELLFLLRKYLTKDRFDANIGGMLTTFNEVIN